MKAVLAQPNVSENLGAHWRRAMRDGDFEAAWAASDQVLAQQDPAGRDDPALPYHLRWVWDGRALAGRAVLVRCYHGLGDTLQFCRYLAPLRRVAAAVTLEVQPALVPLLTPLMSGSDGPTEIVAFEPAAPLAPAECDVEIMELAHALRIAPRPAPYLPVVRTPPAAGALRVGLCWRANASWQPERSVPTALLNPLLAMGGIVWHSLQPGATLPGGAACPAAVVDTARVVAGLDLVITVDTMVAHLAGAIGTPFWLLLQHTPDWRWLAGGRRASPWYGDVVKFQQVRAGEWEAPLADVRGALTCTVNAGTFRK